MSSKFAIASLSLDLDYKNAINLANTVLAAHITIVMLRLVKITLSFRPEHDC